MKDKELNVDESRDEEVEFVTADELRRGMMAARVNRFFAERAVDGKVVMNVEDCSDPTPDEHTVLAIPTSSGVAFMVAYELRRSMVSSVSRFFSVISAAEVEFSFGVFEQKLRFIHHLVAGPDVEDVDLDAAVDRLRACVGKYLPSIMYFEEVAIYD